MSSSAAGDVIYLIVSRAPCYALSADSFATESAFAEHLRQLRRIWKDRFDHLIIAAPLMEHRAYEARQSYFSVVKAGADGVVFVPMHPHQTKGLKYWLTQLLPNVFRLRKLIKSAALVHSGPSHFYDPFGFFALLMAAAAGKPTVFVLDIDWRRSSLMNYRTGRWSLKSHWLAKCIYDPFISAQVRVAARMFSLVLLKGQGLCDDYGRDNPRVRNFMDSAFSAEHIIPEVALEKKLAQLTSDRPLEVVFFGRLTGYKGLDRSITAIAKAMQLSKAAIRFHVVGTGEDEQRLRAVADRLGIADRVIFHGSIPFGRQLFDFLYGCDLLLATPMSEDTPRNALDAMASGIPILAFDTYYYRDLVRSGAVEVVPWPSVDAMAEKLAGYALAKPSLETPIRSGVEFARANTQEIWLRRRHQWTCEVLDARNGP